MKCNKYSVAYSHKGIVGRVTIEGVDRAHAIRNIKARFDARWGKANYCLDGAAYAGKPKGTVTKGKPTHNRSFPTPPNPEHGMTTNYAAMAKYGAYRYEV